MPQAIGLPRKVHDCARSVSSLSEVSTERCQRQQQALCCGHSSGTNVCSIALYHTLRKQECFRISTHPLASCQHPSSLAAYASANANTHVAAYAYRRAAGRHLKALY